MLKLLLSMQTNNNLNVFTKIRGANSETLPPSPLPPPPPAPHVTQSTLIVFSITAVMFCFLGFTIIFCCRFCFVSLTGSTTPVHLSPIVESSPFRGLDTSLLQTFPTFQYDTVKDLRTEKKYSLECAICLFEFDKDSMLRLLTVCYHVFHQECIDLWLQSHKTCPVCRTDLEAPKPQELDNTEEEERKNHNDHNCDHEHDHDHDHDHVCIDMKEGDEDRKHDHDDGGEGSSMSGAMQAQKIARSRSHSTGHSVVMVREGGEGRDGGDDKYTLRLPEHVTLKIIRGGHNYSKSCTNTSYKDVPMRAAPCSNCGHVQTVFGSSSHNDTKN